MSSFRKREPRAASAISSSGSSLKRSGGAASSSGLIAWQHLADVVVERVVGVGVVLRVAGDLLLVLAVVLAEQQVVAVLHRAERRRHEDRHEAVLGQLEVVDDVRPQQAQGVRERREPEAGPELLGDRRAADEVAALEDERAQAGLGQVRAVRQAVVAATDDDRVVGPVGLRPRAASRRVGAVLGRPSVGDAAFLDVFGIQAVLRSGLNRGCGPPGVEVLVAVADRQLELDPRAGRGPVERDAGEGDVRWSIGEYIWLVA